MRPHRRLVLASLSLAAATIGLAGPADASDGTVFLESATEHGDGTVTLPLYTGTSRGRTVHYVVIDASTSTAADQYGANRANKLAKARGTAAVQKVTVRGGVIDFPASVDFGPERTVVPGPGGFPPEVAEPGAIGEAGYSPLIQLPDGTVLNAPQVANGTGLADKVIDLDVGGGTVRYEETDGFAAGHPVRYLSFDASDPAVAALEASTFAPALNAAPTVGQDGTDQSRASLAAFVNGRTGADNPERQGLNSALIDGLAPLNVLAWAPNQGRYSPLWDVHPAAWTDAAIAAGRDVRQDNFFDVAALADDGLVTGPAARRSARPGSWSTARS
jgi:hypothetical protein